MQLSELLGLDVLDDTDARLGTVVDVRLTVDGDLDENPDPPTLFGLVVSPRTRSSYLGMNVPTPADPRCWPRCCAGATAAPSWPCGTTSDESTRSRWPFGPGSVATHQPCATTTNADWTTRRCPSSAVTRAGHRHRTLHVSKTIDSLSLFWRDFLVRGGWGIWVGSSAAWCGTTRLETSPRRRRGPLDRLSHRRRAARKHRLRSNSETTSAAGAAILTISKSMEVRPLTAPPNCGPITICPDQRS